MAVINLGDKDGMGSSFTGTYSASDINNAINAAGIPSNCKVTSLTVEFRGAKSTSIQGSGSITLTLGSYSATYSGVIANNGFDNSFSDSDKICYDSKIINYVNSNGRFNNNLVFTLSKGSSLTGWRVNAKLHIEYTIPYTISVSAGAGGSVTNTGGTYNAGTTFSVQADPQVGYKFKGWANSNGVIATTANPYSFTVSGSASFSAVFEPITYYVSYNANGGSGTIGAASVKFGDNYTLASNTFTAPEVILTYNWNGGSYSVAAISVKKPFKGWEDLGSIKDSNGTEYSADVFDAPYYSNTQADLYAAFGYNKYSLINHYVNSGKNEGRAPISSNGIRGTYPDKATVNSLGTTEGATVPLKAQWGSCTFSPGSPTKDGCKFLGWLCNGTLYKPGEYIYLDESTTAVAQWEETKKLNVYVKNKKATVYVGNTEVKEIYVGNTKVYG